MKKLLLFLTLMLAGSVAHATESIYGDLFAFENKHSSFTVDVDTIKMDRMAIQVVFSTEVISNMQIAGNSFSASNDTVQVSSTNNYASGLPVLLASAPTVAPAPLVSGTTYFMVKVNDTLLKFATTYAQAISRDTIDITGTGISSNTFTLIPVPLNTGSAAFSWFGSNDATNWIAVGASNMTVNGSTQSLVSMGATSTGSRIFDWGEYAYRYLRFTFTGPTYGSIKMRALIHAKLRS